MSIVPKVVLYSKTDLNIGNVETWMLTNHRLDVRRIWEHLKKKKKISLDDSEKFKMECYSEVDVSKPHFNVMFSGGWDSVSLVIKHLEKGETVIPFYVVFNEKWIPIVQLEIKLLRKVYGAKLLDPLHLMFSSLYLNGNEEMTLSQQAFCAFCASRIDGRFQENAIATEIAYCMNDDAVSFLNDLKELYNASSRVVYPERKNPPLKFPLIKNKHFGNSLFVEMWMKEKEITLPVTGMDNGEADFEFGVDENGNKWIAVLSLKNSLEKENKAGLFATGIIIRFKE